MNTQTNLIPEEEQNNLRTGEQLLPKELEAIEEREGASTPQPEANGSEDFNKTSGYRISEQGLSNNNNEPIAPSMSTENKSLNEKRRNYTMIGIVGLAIFSIFLGITALMNMVNMTV